MSSFDPDFRDDLVTAYLDGEATPDERALVEADPDLIERATLLRAVSDLVAAPVDIDRVLRNAHIDAAVAASTTAQNVIAIDTRRARWRDARVLSAAAVVLAALVAVPIALGSRDRSDDTATAISSINRLADDSTARLESSDVSDGSAGAAGAAQADDSDMAEAAVAPAEPLALGPVTDVEDLETRVRALESRLAPAAPAADDAYSTTLTAESLADLACAAATGDADGLGIATIGTARLDGGDVAFAVTLDFTRLIVVDAATCELLHDVALP
jgi:hypothetical protein